MHLFAVSNATEGSGAGEEQTYLLGGASVLNETARRRNPAVPPVQEDLLLQENPPMMQPSPLANVMSV
jgi:hypothetical protein